MQIKSEGERRAVLSYARDFYHLGFPPFTHAHTPLQALGGGVPIGAMLCKEHADVFGPGDHASTYGGNPLACAAANCVAQKLTKGGLVENCEARGEQLRGGLQAAVKRHPDVLEGVRGWGLINGLVIREDSAVLAGAVVGLASELGLLLVPAGPKVVRFVPPLVVTAAEVDQALATLEAVLQDLKKA